MLALSEERRVVAEAFMLNMHYKVMRQLNFPLWAIRTRGVESSVCVWESWLRFSIVFFQSWCETNISACVCTLSTHWAFNIVCQLSVVQKTLISRVNSCAESPFLIFILPIVTDWMWNEVENVSPLHLVGKTTTTTWLTHWLTWQSSLCWVTWQFLTPMICLLN